MSLLCKWSIPVGLASFQTLTSLHLRYTWHQVGLRVMETSQWNPSTGMPDLEGKVAVVTGGRWVSAYSVIFYSDLHSFSSGIGLETVRFLAQNGAKVYLTTRSEARARQAKDKLTKYADINPRNVQYLVMDLYDPVSITHAVEDLKRNETKLHILSMSETLYLHDDN